MKRIIITFTSVMLVVLAFGQTGFKNEGNARLAPRLLNYQGYLTDTQGNPINNSSLSLSFAIFDAVSAGSQKWSETQSSVSVDKGIFNVLLGSVSPIPDSVFTASTSRYLELTVSGQTLTPRTQIVSAPYAYTSTYSDTAVYARTSAPDNNWTFRITDTADTTLQMGGRWGLTRMGNMLYGAYDSTHVNFGVACTTGTSGQNLRYCVVAGGHRNKAVYNHATVGGGENNTAIGVRATVGGGYNNTASGYAATVSGGYTNIADSDYASVGGGENNTAYGGLATVCGGYGNRADSQYSFVGGGYSNAANGLRATVAGGYDNTASGMDATVGGGNWNMATGNYTTVSGGYGNRATNVYASVCGGEGNTAGGEGATVGGGLYNRAESLYAFAGGGYQNAALNQYATACGGFFNYASGYMATVGGGGFNRAIGSYTIVGGGYYDTTMAYLGGVLSGYSNLAGNETADTGATVAGGYDNSANSKFSFVGGGRLNRADSNYTAVGGGYADTASGYYATVPGGIANKAAGNYSFAAGRRAKANNQGCFVWGDATDASVLASADNRWVARCSGGVYFYTNSGMTTGSYLAAGGGSWASVSDRNMKENFEPVDGSDVLSRLVAIPITTWNYKSQDPSIRHIGPMAQDFAGFGVGEDDKHITTIDADGIALAAIQELNRKLERLESENRELRQRIEILESK